MTTKPRPGLTPFVLALLLRALLGTVFFAASCDKEDCECPDSPDGTSAENCFYRNTLDVPTPNRMCTYNIAVQQATMWNNNRDCIAVTYELHTVQQMGNGGYAEFYGTTKLVSVTAKLTGTQTRCPTGNN